MANLILIEQQTPIVWADSVQPYAGDGGARTHQIDLDALAAAAARQGAKADLSLVAYSGVAGKRAELYAVTLFIEWATDPTDGETADLYFGVSVSDTAGTANPGGLTGVDAAYTGTAGSTLAESLKQLDFVGSLIATNDDDPVVQVQTFLYAPALDNVMPVVVNSATPAFHNDAIEMCITMTPLTLEVQNAA